MYPVRGLHASPCFRADLNVYVNEKVVFGNLDNTAAAIGPISFEAKKDDTLRIEAINAGETGVTSYGCMQLTPVYLRKGTKTVLVHGGAKHMWDYFYGNFIFVNAAMPIPW
jgi:hypothetical protein